jgi:hypothetical protein
MSIAIPSYGTLLQVDDGGGASFTTVAGIKNPGSVQRQANMVDVTEHNTGSPWREMAPTLLTLSPLTVELNWVASNATHDYSAGLGYLFDGRLKRTWRWLCNTDAGSCYHEFQGYVSQIGETAALDNVYSAQVQITPTGAPTFYTGDISVSPSKSPSISPSLSTSLSPSLSPSKSPSISPSPS